MSVWCTKCGTRLHESVINIPDYQCAVCKKARDSEDVMKRLPTALDAFAAAALQGILASGRPSTVHREHIVQEAWGFAHEMMRLRK